MVNKVEKAIRDFSLISHADKVIVALSGGADSVALLFALNSIKEKYNLTLYACHLNHMIRGDEADSDESFVRNLCEALNIKLFVKSQDVISLAKEEKISVELAGRNARYEFFAQLCDELGAKVATAHTASDNVETVIYNLSRGASLNGLCGIKPMRDDVIRPLILCSRAEVEAYCKDNNLQFVTDSTNLTDEYTRNDIRHNVVPVLKSINPDLENAVTRMSSSLTQISDYLDYISELELKNAQTEYGYDVSRLLSLHSAVLNHCIYLIVKKSGFLPENRHISLIVDAMSSGGCVDLCVDKRAVCKQGLLRIVDADDDTECMSETTVDDYQFKKYYSFEELKNINKNLLNNCIDCDIIDDSVTVRTRRQGDTFTLPQRDITKSLKKLLNELKVPYEKRSLLLLVAKGSTVLWLEGVGTSKQGRVTANTKKAVRIFRG